MRFGGALLALALIASPALADVEQTGALPPALVSAGVTPAEWDAVRAEVNRQARRASVSEAALLAAAQASGANFARSGHFNALTLQQAIFGQLGDQADQLAELQRRLDAQTGDADPQIARVFADARAALNEGRLADADGLLAQVEQSDLAAMQQADAEVERRRLRVGDTIAARGQVAYVQADYLAAADFYERAADTVPQAAVEQRWRHISGQADALATRGQLFVEPGPLYEAVRLYRDVALPLAPRDARANDWATTQNDMGDALRVLGERGDDQALRDAVTALRNALIVDTRGTAPASWARDQFNLAIALRVLGERGDDQALRDAVTALRNALTVDTRETSPTAWATDQSGLGGALMRLGERGDDQLLLDAAAALRDALTVHTRETEPIEWASDQSNLSAALSTLSERRGDDQALRDSIAAARSALTVHTRENAPADWAADQLNLSKALGLLGIRGDSQALRDAIIACRAALEVWTRESDSAHWASATYSLGNALASQGDDQALRDAVAAYRAALEVLTRESDPAHWADAQLNLGDVLHTLGARGDVQALHDAVVAYRAALTVRTRDRDPSGWSDTQYSMATVLRDLAARGDRSQRTVALAAAHSALAGYRQIGADFFAQQAQTLIARLERMR